MHRFHVWIRPLASACKVRVDGIKNADWLLNRLSESFVFKSCEPIREDSSPCCTFCVVYSFQMCHRSFGRLLAGIPEVQLNLDSA